MAVQWGLAPTGNSFLQGWQAGEDRVQQREQADALLGYRREQQEMQRRVAKQEDQQGQQQQIAEAAQTLAPVYQELSRMPYEQRRQWLQQIAPRLTARGIPPEVIAGYDPTDDNLRADIMLTQRAATGDAFTLSPGQVRYGADGQELARGPAPAPNYIPLQPGGRLVLEPGTGGPTEVAGPAGPQPGAVEDGYRFRGGDPADPNSWEPVNQGGAGPAGPRNFR